MSNDILNSLLKEYEQKKLKAELDLEKKKETLYQKLPELEKIENELNHYAIQTAKNILKDEPYSLEEMKQKIELLKYKKSCILQEANLSIHDLEPVYECPICKDTGYVMGEDYKTTMCNCLKQRLLDYSFHKSNMSGLTKENFDTFNENLFSDEVDIAKFKFNISPRENIKNIKQKCIQFVNEFDNPECKNLLFSGNTGLR